MPHPVSKFVNSFKYPRLSGNFGYRILKKNKGLTTHLLLFRMKEDVVKQNFDGSFYIARIMIRKIMTIISPHPVLNFLIHLSTQAYGSNNGCIIFI